MLVKDYYWYMYSECICKCLGNLVTVTNATPGPENGVPVHENVFAYAYPFF